MLNQHLINHLIISLTLTLRQCYFNTIWHGTKYTLGSVDLTLGILLRILSQSSVYCLNVSSFKAFMSSFYSATSLPGCLCLY